MSAQVTEEHIYTTAKVGKAYVAGEDAQAAQLIADSEATACDQLRAEVERLKKYSANLENDVKYLTQGVPEGDPLFLAVARAELAEAELANIRALANRRNKRDHSADTTHQLVAALDQALDIAQAELATERARIADLVADLNDACITLTSAEEDCDDYAMQNTGFKLTAVREVLLQHIPNAAMKEEIK